MKSTMDNKKKTESKKESESKPQDKSKLKKEIGGQEGPEPTRFGDWEKKGITSDF